MAVEWLLAVPISRSEADFAGAKGAAALERLLDQRSIDIFDLDRAAVV